ncbi:MAG: alpha/beta hydrolase [Sphingomonadales bacterium]|nr:alpha/beta hydrolase [Sphingomonadales bacterium]
MSAIEPFRIDLPQTVLDDLHDRLTRTRWTADFANDDWAYGANTAYIRDVADHWQNGYDWRAREATMNRHPQFRTEIDGLPIHFQHIRGNGPNPTPLLLSHGWPWTFHDFHKLIEPLTNPENPADAFTLVIPSLPGFGFSTPLARPGVNWWRTADLWVKLMDRLGYPRFGAHGGDVGAFISAQLGHKHAERIIGVHLTTPGPLTFMTGGGWDASDYSAEEARHFPRMAQTRAAETGHFIIQSTKPQNLAVAFADSPAGLLAWLVDKRRAWADTHGHVESRFSKDDLLDNAMLYWATQSYHTSARYYYEGAHHPWQPSHARTPVVAAPTAVAVFPAELTFAPRAAAARYYNLQRWTEMPEGGHFAAMEVPDLLAADLRTFFRELR